MMTLSEAKEVLRVDGTANDNVILALIAAMPSYIETQTGMGGQEQLSEPMIPAVEQYLITSWYYKDKADDVRLQRTLQSLLHCITMKHNAAEREAAAE